MDRLEVPLHVTFLVKGGGARRTRVRPRPAVDAHVPLQVVLLVAAVETLAAGGTSGEGGAGGGGVVALLAPLQDKATLRPPPALPPPLPTRLHTPAPTTEDPTAAVTGASSEGVVSLPRHPAPHDSPEREVEVNFFILTDCMAD